MFQQVTEFIGRNPSRREAQSTVKCSACLIGVRVRAFPEIVDCSHTNRMRNADLDRVCPFYVGGHK